MFARLATLFQTWLAAGGIPVLFAISFLENTLLPIPGEAILPVAGFLVNQGTYSYWAAVLAATVGATLGASTTYAVGRFGGQPFIKRYGVWFGITRRDLTRAQNYFKKYGSLTIFICRFLPAVRQVSSLPAGAAKMRYSYFAVATFFGALLWNSMLIGLGWYFGDAWERLLTYGAVLDYVGLTILIVILIWFFKTHAPRIIKEIDAAEKRKEQRAAEKAKKLRTQSRRKKR